MVLGIFYYSPLDFIHIKVKGTFTAVLILLFDKFMRDTLLGSVGFGGRVENVFEAITLKRK